MSQLVQLLRRGNPFEIKRALPQIIEAVERYEAVRARVDTDASWHWYLLGRAVETPEEFDSGVDELMRT